jgi:hypothetical protein
MNNPKLEEQFILRVPPNLAAQIRKMLRSKESEAGNKKKDESQQQNAELNIHLSFEGTKLSKYSSI